MFRLGDVPVTKPPDLSTMISKPSTGADIQSHSRILVADSDVDSVAVITYALAKAGYRVLTSSGPDALEGILREHPDVAVMDCSDGDGSGPDRVRRLRREPQTEGVGLVLVAEDPDPSLRVEALAAGADDFIAKPFAPEELILRIRNILQRRSSARIHTTPTLVVGPIEVDLGDPFVKVDGNAVALTPTEYRLMTALAERAGRVMSRSELLQRVWNVQNGAGSRTVDIHVRRLRAKLGDASTLLESVRGFGYRLNNPAAPPDH